MSQLSSIKSVKRSQDGTRPPPPPSKIFIHLLIDRSYSMISLQDSLLNSINEFIQTQQKLSTSHNTTLTITTFDTIKTTLQNFNDVPLNLAPQINPQDIQPRGSTRLIDSAMEVLFQQQKQKNHYFQNNPSILPHQVLCIFALLTDGQDNVSQKFSSQDLQSYLSQLQNDNQLTAYFLASNQDAITSGTNLGFTPGNSITYTPSPLQTTTAFRAVSAAVAQSSQGIQTEFTPLQREQSISQPSL